MTISKIKTITIFKKNGYPQILQKAYPNSYKIKRHNILYDESIDGPLPDDFDENKIGGYKLVDGVLAFDQTQFDANEALKQELNLAEIAKENTITQRKNTIKNVNASIPDRLNALIEHLGLNV